MAGRASYTPEDRARAFVTLTANDNNVKRTARDTGFPENTIRRWRDDWAANGPPSTEQVDEAVGAFMETAVSVRDTALHVIKLKLELLKKDPEKAKLAELSTVLGVLDDKITRASGLATGRVEHVHQLPPADEIRRALGGVFQAALEATRTRDLEIIEAEVVAEDDVRALPSGA